MTGRRVAQDRVAQASGLLFSASSPESVEQANFGAIASKQPAHPKSREVDASASPALSFQAKATNRSGRDARNSRPEACATQDTRIANIYFRPPQRSPFFSTTCG